jgi:hypothetical protein
MARRWTEKELDYLANHVGLLSYNELARKLHRSRAAVKLCRCKHGMPTFYNGDYYSMTLLSKELGRSSNTISKYHRKGWLKGKKATWRTIYWKNPYLFTENNIMEFLRGHFQLFDWKKIPNLYFKNVVKGLYNAQNATQNNDPARHKTGDCETLGNYQEAGCIY